MKKIQDIYKKTEIEDVDIHDEEISRSPHVLSNDTRCIDDISLMKNRDINLQVPSEIKLQKKRGKNFDALEKKSPFSQLKRSKSITLKKKQKKFSLSLLLLLIHRKIKFLGKGGKILLLFTFLLGILFLGYFDKLLVENRVNSGYTRLLTIKEGHLGFEDIKKQVNNARFDLLLADVLFSPFSLFTGDKIDSVDHAISGGRHLSRALDDMLGLYSKTDDFIAEKSLNKIYFTQLFLNIYPGLQEIERSLNSAIHHYKSISWLPSEDLDKQKQEAIKNIENIQTYVSKITSNFSDFLDIFGHSKKRRYLIVFQNADEIRPGGGFMGSMGLLEVYRGKVVLFQKKDVYAIEWDLKKSDYERRPAPKGINELTPTFGLRDANYFVNLKDSSNTIKFFTDRAGIDIDGVIYINQNILLHLLEITGPVYFEALKRDITSENFSEIMSLLVEAKTFKSGTLGTPKQILFDFMEVFSQKLIGQAEYFNYIQSFIHDVESRDIMMWSFHENENNFLKTIGLRGDIEYDTSFDFTYPVYTSLSGNKSDRYMKRSYTQKVTSGEQCSYDIDLQIQSTHDMGKKKRDNIESLIDEYSLDSPNLLKIQGADRNRQFVRIILPNDAQIVPQSGMQILDYGSRKGVEFFLNTELQETSYYNISYTLANTKCHNYDFKFYKQSGIPSYDIQMDINGEKYKYTQRKEDFYFEKRN